MRIILYLWAVPLALFWGWYTLSYYDLSFGTIFLSRKLHELVFLLYGRMLGVPAGEVPAMVAWACAFDTSIIGAIAAWRWRANWYPRTHAYVASRLFRESGAGTSLGAEGNERTVSGRPSPDPAPATALQAGPAHPAE